MSFSDKMNVNIITALLRAHGVRKVVLCPGSRNAPLSHNLLEAGLDCHAVTDERSAGFFTLGMALATGEPVAVCVTSGSALLNLAPAVAEAACMHVPIVVISADRPADRIGQLVGQTIVQPGALTGLAGYNCTLPEPHDAASRRHCERLVNEALLHAAEGTPVHINVPISEPLYHFTEEKLPDVRVIRRISVPKDMVWLARSVIGMMDAAQRPVVVVGQTRFHPRMSDIIAVIGRRYPVLYESLSSTSGGLNLDLISDLAAADSSLSPDLVIYVGDTLVSNKIKRYLTSLPQSRTVGVNVDGEVHDTFMNQSVVIGADPVDFLSALAEVAKPREDEFGKRWSELIEESRRITSEKVPRSVEAHAVKMLETALQGREVNMHYANSTAVRMGNLYSSHYTFVNRGVNGIEGSLSAAAGFSLVAAEKTFCVIGDLSFFYDCNALWPAELDGRLRVMLLNNGGGKIFDILPGAKESAAFGTFVRGNQAASAKGICEAYNIGYIACDSEEAMKKAINTLIATESDRPLLLEILNVEF